MVIETLLERDGAAHVGGVPAGVEGDLLATLAARAFADGRRPVLHVARDDARLAATEISARFFDPELEIIRIPAWDCLPYDRVSPHADIVAERMASLATLAGGAPGKPRLVLTTVNALLQRVCPRAAVKQGTLKAAPGDALDPARLTDFLAANGYTRAGQVMEPGDYAVRGGLVDLFPPGADKPLRLDFFGDELDSIRAFDPLNQRTVHTVGTLSLTPASELSLGKDSITRFRRAYVAGFGPAKGDDILYEAISTGRKAQGAEHWLPLFHDSLERLTDYLPDALITLDPQADDAAKERIEAIADYYGARATAWELVKDGKGGTAPPYKPVPVTSLYLDAGEWDALLEHAHRLAVFDGPDPLTSLHYGARPGRDFAPERQQRDTNVYDAVAAHADAVRRAGKRAVFASYTAGAADRLQGVLEDHGVMPLGRAEGWADIRRSPAQTVAVTVLPIETGFETETLVVITEQDILGDRLIRRARRQKKAENFLTDAAVLTAGDLVVHASHGIGRFEGLETVTVSGAAHDCLRLTYQGGDTLFVPVENIEVLTRYGSEDAGAQLDKLGGVAWQARKARMKQRIREIADGLIKLAAARALKPGEKILPPAGAYDEFCARFPFSETDDQLRAIGDVTQDLSRGRPMDRLVCGDVGFGKTEVALRAAFMAVMAGHQVAVVAPTTLLARQHFLTFRERFKDLPVRIGHLSRLVRQKEATATKKALEDGTLDIVVGTHALLGRGVAFKRLSLLVVDEEQRFGVGHKEKLKALKADVHVLTLTATPIPRTLQMAMSGIRDLSIIATPPVDRLAVRTFVLPFDPVVVREALLREHYRGGQSFYICPRIADLEEAGTFLKEQVPEVKFAVAHGQMSPGEIEEVMTGFYDGRFDVLLSTTIIESGIDVPSANTLVVHRADMFGLAQLYQIRGRVGRSKARAYAYLTVPAGRLLTSTADKRLEVLQTLDTLGAGFTIASHDMDIRGAGNLLGEEQSGHVREVGVELYQKMLEDAVAEARAGSGEMVESDWSPQINLGATVMIPDGYVADLSQRMALYRRLGGLESREDVDAFMAELIDRFGPLPGEVKQLGAVMIIKGHAKRAGIEKLEAGPKGLTLSFRDNTFANPSGLVDFIAKTGQTAKIRPDHTLVYYARMDKIGQRLKTVAAIARKLATLAETTDRAA